MAVNRTSSRRVENQRTPEGVSGASATPVNGPGSRAADRDNRVGRAGIAAVIERAMRRARIGQAGPVDRPKQGGTASHYASSLTTLGMGRIHLTDL
jgi:hypothetical protein